MIKKKFENLEDLKNIHDTQNLQKQVQELNKNPCTNLRNLLINSMLSLLQKKN